MIERVIDSLMAYKPEKIILFGSMARGDADEYSDIDLIIVKQTAERFIQRQVTAISFVPRDVKADIFVYTPEEWDRFIAVLEDPPAPTPALLAAVERYNEAIRTGVLKVSPDSTEEV